MSHSSEKRCPAENVHLNMVWCQLDLKDEVSLVEAHKGWIRGAEGVQMV